MDEKLFSDEIRERERKRRRGGLLWNIASFVLHVALFVAIVLLTPVKSLVFEEKEKANPAAELSSDRLEQISESLSEARINELVQEHGTTLLFVSHSIEQVERVCEKAVWIEKGEMRMIGDSKDVCEAYRNIGQE